MQHRSFPAVHLFGPGWAVTLSTEWHSSWWSRKAVLERQSPFPIRLLAGHASGQRFLTRQRMLPLSREPVAKSSKPFLHPGCFYSLVISHWAEGYAGVKLFIVDARFACSQKGIGAFKVDEESLDEICGTAQTFSSKDKNHTTRGFL